MACACRAGRGIVGLIRYILSCINVNVLFLSVIECVGHIIHLAKHCNHHFRENPTEDMDPNEREKSTLPQHCVAYLCTLCVACLCTHALPACVLAALPACVLATLPACVRAALPACVRTTLPACVRTAFPACVRKELHACVRIALPEYVRIALHAYVRISLLVCVRIAFPACIRRPKKFDECKKSSSVPCMLEICSMHVRHHLFHARLASLPSCF